MNRSFATAFLDVPHTVCGFALAPFTLRHAFMLEALESPLALEGNRGPITFEDLFAAAQLCSTRNEAELAQWQNVPMSGNEKKALHEKAQKMRPHHVHHQLAWNRYLANYTTLPRLMPTAHPGKWQCDAKLITVTKLMALGKSEAEAWWTPFARARWITLAADETNPHVSFTLLTDQRRAALQRLGHTV